MIKSLLPVIAVLSAFILSGCELPKTGENKAGLGAKPPEGTVAATVNGQPITEETIKLIAEANRNPNLSREKIIENLVNQELLAQDALSKHLESKPGIAEKLNYVQRQILSQAAVQDFVATSPISDADIQKEYEQTYASTEQKNYQARHILTDTEDKANEVIQKLKDGGSFDALAKEYSTDPSTRNKGGDLGWFSPDHMVKPFAEAVAALADGDYNLVPVKTQFGWHVILREGSRAQIPPVLESVKAKIQHQLQQDAIEKHLETLKASAKVEIIPPKPAPPPPAPAVPPETPAPIEPKAGAAGTPPAST
ncbi:MAG: peptidylprolyl isomerase, partial [Methylococcales bacterium]